MKNINKIIISLIFAIALSSCSKDFLNVHPYDKKVLGNFYQTPNDAWEALVSVYYGLCSHNDGGGPTFSTPIILSETASDECFGGCGASDDQRFQIWDDCDWHNFPNPHDNMWKDSYENIYRANIFLQYIDNVNWGNNANLKTQYIAECKFLRAYFYFDLIRVFGNIPLLNKVIDVDHLDIPQAKPEEVYTLIANDLLFAINNLAPVAYQNISPNDYGRVTKWAAEALLARVHLFYTGYYGQSDIAGIVKAADVRNYIDDIVSNSGYMLVDDYTHLWQYSYDKFVGEDNMETVFTVKYTYKGYNLAGKNVGSYNGNRWQVMIGLRTQVIPPYGNGWGACTVNPALYYSYAPGDTRRDGSILCWDSLHVKFDTHDQREYTGFNWRKYCPLTIGPNSSKLQVDSLGADYQADNFFDYAVIRYSDVLLMGAELHLDDNLSLAQNYFNQVRDRAFKDANHRIALTSGDVGKKIIMNERKFEFALEGVRYWDLLRLGIHAAADTINASNPYTTNYQHMRAETNGLFAIPVTQINLSNGSLIQNPGW